MTHLLHAPRPYAAPPPPDFRIAPQPWTRRALCKDESDLNLMFPEPNESGKARSAKRLCGKCPVREECLAFALVTGEQHGIWGGLSIHARRRHPNFVKPRPVHEVIRYGTGCNLGYELGDSASGASRHRTRGEKPCKICARSYANWALKAHHRRERAKGRIGSGVSNGSTYLQVAR